MEAELKAELELTKQLKEWEIDKVIHQQQLQANVNIVDNDIDNRYLPKPLSDVGVPKGDINVHTFRHSEIAHNLLLYSL